MLNTAPSELEVNVAVLDKDGVIVDVNDLWRRFAQENGGSPEATGVGSKLPLRSVVGVPAAVPTPCT